MPKIEKKVLTSTLYTYVKPVNDQWVRKQAKKKGMSYSAFVDQMLDQARSSKTKASRSKAA